MATNHGAFEGILGGANSEVVFNRGLFQVIGYVEFQYIQVALCAILAVLARATSARHINASRVMFVWVIIGYGFVCSISNIVRFNKEQVTALFTLSTSDYATASLWWCAYASVLHVGVYLWWLTRENSTPMGSESETRIPNGAVIYTLAFFVLVALHFLNPFRGVDFGIFNASSQGDLKVGGLLVGIVLLNILGAVAVSLLRYARLVGLLACLAVTWMYAQTGSKRVGGQST